MGVLGGGVEVEAAVVVTPRVTDGRGAVHEADGEAATFEAGRDCEPRGARADDEGGTCHGITGLADGVSGR
jgi:hypothetical protein